MARSEKFADLFYEKEYEELIGRKQVVAKRLIVLLTLTFCALGFAVGGLNQLQVRMNNPFTRWVDFTVDAKAEGRFVDMTEFLNDSENKTAYHLDGYSNWNRYWLFFHHRRHDPVLYPVDTLTHWQKGRTIDFGDELFEEIISDENKNLIRRNDSYFDDEGNVLNLCGIIVTERLLDKLGYAADETSFIESLSLSANSGRDLLFLPIIAVVNNLPSRSDFMSSHHLDNILQGDGIYDHLLQNVRNDTSKVRLIGYSTDQRQLLKASLAEKFPEVASTFLIQSSSLLVDSTKKYKNYTVILPESISRAEAKSWWSSMEVQQSFQVFAELDCSDDADEIKKSMYRTFNFSDLDEIRPFQKIIEDRFDLRLPMELVENRENFNLVAKLTLILGAALFVFGLFSILIYLSNLINNHVYKIRSHLGTFKAMGLSDKELLNTYSKIALKLLLTSILVSLPLSLILGHALDYFAFSVGYNLFSMAIPLAIILILGSVTLLIRTQLKSVFSATPGDLIYEREKEIS